MRFDRTDKLAGNTMQIIHGFIGSIAPCPAAFKHRNLNQIFVFGASGTGVGFAIGIIPVSHKQFCI